MISTLRDYENEMEIREMNLEIEASNIGMLRGSQSPAR